MSERDDHVRLEALMAEAMRAPDPVAALAQLAEDRRLPDAFRSCLQGLDPDGLRLSSLLVARLRFERLMHGSVRAQQWFDEDGAAFAAAFRVYHEQVAPSAALPAAEARLFEQWLDQRKTAS